MYSNGFKTTEASDRKPLSFVDEEPRDVWFTQTHTHRKRERGQEKWEPNQIKKVIRRKFLFILLDRKMANSGCTTAYLLSTPTSSLSTAKWHTTFSLSTPTQPISAFCSVPTAALAVHLLDRTRDISQGNGQRLVHPMECHSHQPL